MTLPRNKTVLALALIALVQTGALATMVIDRMWLLKVGREITLPIRPVDPRDLFKGEYVRLGYDIDSVPVRLLEGPAPASNAAFYVVLERTEAGVWRPIKLTRDKPNETSPERVVLKGRPVHNWLVGQPNAMQRVRYGIESYFVPQGDGERLEGMAREKKLAARIAVDGRGNAAIKGLVIDGELQYEEPLF